MAMREVFSKIPLLTWRWLGVNELPLPQNLGKAKSVTLSCMPGEQKSYIIDLRESGLQEITVDVPERAKMHVTFVQFVSTDQSAASRIKAEVGKQGLFSCTIAEIGAAHTASELHVTLAGDEARADVWGLYFGDAERKIDLNYIIRQEGQRTDANMQVRGALLNRSVKTFRGTLDFVQGARGSTGKEDEEVTILSPHVRNRSVPLMLSHEGDVDGHHAVSIGKMDEEKLFYLMSRGLDDRAAQQLIVEASFEPVLARIENDELRAEIAHYLERRLLGGAQEL
ncbi:SufB/SufD family protein [Selenomonas noxia]|jgi:ABC-type transport system involved in Fe-S cluster assembly, permease component|uniref:SufB/SufD family protein n=1 Tax=Selenomonas noxia TaxID=135083 RepID=UPI002358237B|nr:SufD family Fe-S cluster assembly protein [Selenomonas noxia]